MKKSSLLMIAVALILSSCGMASKYTSETAGSRFQDGIYSSAPSFRSKEDKAQTRAQTDALVEETKASYIYLFGDKKDTVMIPENMSASIRYDKSLASTVVTVGENPYAWQNNLDPWYYYTPYSIGSSWYWSRHYDPWYSNAWYWSRWHRPYSYYYGGWYDPWYYGGWYDPYYYGGLWDPWYYGGYYGGYYGWNPYWGHHHHHYYPAPPVHNEDRWHGDRRQSGSDRVFTSRVSTRGGVASASRVSRSTSAQSASASRVSGSAVSSGRTTAKRVTATAANSSANRQSATTVDKTVTRTVTRTANYRKPEGATRPSGSVTRSSSDNQSTGTSYRSSSGSSSTSRSYGTSNSSTYRSSSSQTPQTRTSSFSTGSPSRSFSGGSSGATRSSGSSGGSRR